MKKINVKLICLSGIFTAAAAVSTAFLQFPFGAGYVHLGDAFIFIAACILPLPYAVPVGVLGGTLADLMTGYALWAPATLIIKALTALCFSAKTERILSKRNYIGSFGALLLCVGGYYLYEAAICKSFVVPLVGIPGNIIQWTFSLAVYFIMAVVLEKLKIKNRL